MQKIKYENFDVLSVEVNGKKSVNIKFFDREQPNRKQTNEDANLPHPDLIARLQDMAPIMAKALGMTKGYDYARDIFAEKKDMDNLKIARDLGEDVANNIEITSLFFFGDKSPSIQLKGSVITDYGKQKLPTPRISLEPGKNDLSDDAQLLSEEVKQEVHQYLFAGKFVKSDKKKKEDEAAKAAEQFDHAAENNGDAFPIDKDATKAANKADAKAGAKK